MSTKIHGNGPPPPPQSWYPPAVIRPLPLLRESVGDATTPRVATSRSGASSGENACSAGTSNGSRPFSPPTAPVATLASLNNKSPQELAEMLNDSKTYTAFLQSLEPLRQAGSLMRDLRESNKDQARRNLEKEAEIAELRNQCTIIRTTELAAAREAFESARGLEREVVESRSPSRFVTMLQEAAAEADEESENMHRALLNGKFDPSEFISKYRSQRLLYHRRMLQRLAAVVPG